MQEDAVLTLHEQGLHISADRKVLVKSEVLVPLSFIGRDPLSRKDPLREYISVVPINILIIYLPPGSFISFYMQMSGFCKSISVIVKVIVLFPHACLCRSGYLSNSALCWSVTLNLTDKHEGKGEFAWRAKCLTNIWYEVCPEPQMYTNIGLSLIRGGWNTSVIVISGVIVRHDVDWAVLSSLW